MRQDAEFWWDAASRWAAWADAASADHDWDAYGLYVHNEIVAKEQAKAEEAGIRDCLS
jgi:hypothetical protein